MAGAERANGVLLPKREPILHEHGAIARSLAQTGSNEQRMTIENDTDGPQRGGEQNGAPKGPSETETRLFEHERLIRGTIHAQEINSGSNAIGIF